MNIKQTVLAAAMAAAFGCAHAQNIQTLEPVVVTASKIEEPQGQATVLVEVIDRRAIEQSGAANITELLDQVSGGILTRQYGRLGVDAAFDLGYLGGSSAQRTLILVDGVRMNDIDDSTIRWGQLPLDAVERVEVRKAGGGVLFGDRALGGVVNIITHRAEDSGSAHITLGSFGTRVIGINNGIRLNGTSVQISAQQAETDGYRDGAEQNLKSIQLGVRHATPIGVIGLRHRSSNEDVFQPYSITLAEFSSNPRFKSPYGTSSRRNGHNTDLIWTSANSSPASWQARFSREESASEAFSNRYRTGRDSLDFQLVYRANFGRINSGLEFFDASSSSSRTNRLRVDQLSTAIYTSLDIPISASVLSFGSRVQDMRNSFQSNSLSDAQFARETLTSWSIGGLTSFGDSILRYSVQSSFAFPTADQLYTYVPFDLDPATTNDGQPVDVYAGVRAMRSYEGQAVLYRNFSSVQVEAGGRQIKIRGEIGEQLSCPGTNGNNCNTNLYDTSRVIGFLKLSGKFLQALSWRVSMDRVESRIDSGPFAGRRVPMVPNFIAKGGIHWARASGRFSLTANHRGEMVQLDDNPNSSWRVPARVILDAGYTHSWRSERRDLSLWLRNLTDKQYFDFARWDRVAPADGRAIEVRLNQYF